MEVHSYAGERLTQITGFASPELFERFGLPSPPDAAASAKPQATTGARLKTHVETLAFP
jgi:hypothetical protein